MKKSVLHQAAWIAVAGICVATAAYADSVFYWRDRAGVSTYSDSPRNLEPSTVQIFNTRTQVSAPAAPKAQAASEPSVADQNQAIIKQNQAIAERNKQIEADNQQRKAAACSAARLNRQAVENSRASNRDALLSHYDQEIQRLCR